MCSRTEAQARRELMQHRVSMLFQLAPELIYGYTSLSFKKFDVTNTSGQWCQWNQQVRHHFLEPKHRQCAFYYIECSSPSSSLSPADRFHKGFDAPNTFTPPDSIEGFYQSIVESTSRGSYHPVGGHYLRVFACFHEACTWAVGMKCAQRLWVIDGGKMDSIMIATRDLPHGDKTPVPSSEHLVVHWIPGKVLVSFCDLTTGNQSKRDCKLSKYAVKLLFVLLLTIILIVIFRKNIQMQVFTTSGNSCSMRSSNSGPIDAQTLRTRSISSSSDSLSSPSRTCFSNENLSTTDCNKSVIIQHVIQGITIAEEESEIGRQEITVPTQSETEILQPSRGQLSRDVERKVAYGVQQILASRTVTVYKHAKRQKRQRAEVIEYLVDWEYDDFGNSWKPEWVRDEDVGHQHKTHWRIKERAWKNISSTPKVFQAIVFDEESHVFEDGTTGQGYLIKWKGDMPPTWIKCENIDSAKRKEYGEKNRNWAAMAKTW